MIEMTMKHQNFLVSSMIEMTINDEIFEYMQKLAVINRAKVISTHIM